MNKLLIVFVFYFLYTCNPGHKDKISGSWKFIGINDRGLSNAQQMTNPDDIDSMKLFLIDYYRFSFINLYSDTGCIVRLGKEFIHANWKINESRNAILVRSKTNNIKVQKEIIINVLGDSVLILKLKPDNKIIELYNRLKQTSTGMDSYIKNNEFLFSFRKDNFKYETKEEDIYSFENNKWRIKPAKPETKEQIATRLKGSLNFTRITLNDAFIRGEGKYDTRMACAPIKLYNQGVGVFQESLVSQEWKDIFYNREQAMQAYKIMVDAFNQKIYPQNKGNWALTDMDLLNQIISKIK